MAMGGAKHPVADAQKTSASTQSEQAPLLVAQNEAPREPQPDALLAAPVAPPVAMAGPTADRSTRAPKTPGARARSSSSKRSVAAARSKPHHVRTPKKLFRTLDF
jgi:hypothetical protein